MVKLKLLLVFIIYSFLVQGQNIKSNDFTNINLDDVIDIKGVIYNKLDSSLVTGKVIRYNRKKEPKRYIIVREGKPDELGWIYFNNNNYEHPETSGLGTLIKAATLTTGLVMEISGNNIDVPFPESNSIKNDNNGLIETEITPLINYNKEIARKAHDEMLQRNEISKNIKPLQSKDSLYEKFYENGQLEINGNYVANKKNGIWKEFYQNGELKRKVNYSKGDMHGLLEQYHPNSKLWAKGFYKYGHMIGEWRYYDDDGDLLFTENYED